MSLKRTTLRFTKFFNRLNSGGINLRSQEIRTSLYHSKFYEMLYKINVEPEWRRLLRRPEPDLHMKDVEILLRAYALLIDVHNYRPSMTKFVNQFSKKSKMNSDSKNEYLERLFFSFLEACGDLPDDIFINKGNNRFNIALYEAVFAVTCKNALQENRMVHGKLSAEHLEQLDNDPEFSDAATKATSGTTNVATRLRRAEAIVNLF